MAIPNYTSEQIVDLVVMLHKNNIHFLSSFFYGRSGRAPFPFSSCGRVCSGDEIYSSKLRRTTVLLLSSPGCDNEVTASMVRRVMFLLPLEKMPLLINDLVLGVIAKWRLKVGR